MAKLFRLDVTIHATAYVRARYPEEALALAGTHHNDMTEDNFREITSSLRFDDPDLPDFSLSPAMTLDTRTSDAIEEVD